MDQEIIHQARLAMLLFREQVQPDAVPDAAKVARAVHKLAAFGRAIEDEQLTDSEAAELFSRTFPGVMPGEATFPSE